MKKLLPAVLTTVLMTLGMAAATPGNAGAAPGDSTRYVPAVRTTCGAFVVGKANHRKRTHVRAEVAAPYSTRQPKGFLTVTVRKFNGRDGDSGRFFTRGGPVDLYLGPLRPGRYSGYLIYAQRPVTSVFAQCQDGFFFRVRRSR